MPMPGLVRRTRTKGTHVALLDNKERFGPEATGRELVGICRAPHYVLR